MFCPSVPVSRPVLTLNPAGTQPVVGDVLELRCEAQRGSPPILYWFYHDNATLGKILAPFGGGTSFNLSLTAQPSGNYSCAADNGLGIQCSEVVMLNFTVPSRSKIILITVGVISGLLSILGLTATAALVCKFKTQRKSRGLSTTGTPGLLCNAALAFILCHIPSDTLLKNSRRLLDYSPNECQEPSLSKPFSTDTQEPTHSELPALMELQPVYSNVNPGDSDLVYSQVRSTQPTKEHLANSPRMHWEHEGSTVIYSEVKKTHPDDSAGQASSGGWAHEDATESYENVPCASMALDH
nr:PREDICTED: Fc receptor-like protein 3 isoform X1 [Equus przewalskii]